MHGKFVCQFAGCSKSFGDNATLKTHQRTHTKIKPYKCTWPSCGHRVSQRSNLIAHIRCHLNLPKTIREQVELGIDFDDRDPNQYVEVVEEFL